MLRFKRMPDTPGRSADQATRNSPSAPDGQSGPVSQAYFEVVKCKWRSMSVSQDPCLLHTGHTSEWGSEAEAQIQTTHTPTDNLGHHIGFSGNQMYVCVCVYLRVCIGILGECFCAQVWLYMCVCD